MKALIAVLSALEPLSKEERRNVLFAAISALDELDNGTSSGTPTPEEVPATPTPPVGSDDTPAQTIPRQTTWKRRGWSGAL